MPLIIALPAREGVVLASDTLQKRGQFQREESRIHQLNNRICWSANGEYSLIQRVGESFEAFQQSNQSLRELSIPIGNMIKASVRDFLAIDFRTDIYMNNIGAITQLHRADFVFAESAPNPQILHMSIVGSPEWVTDQPYLLGSGDVFAGTLLRKYQEISLDLRLASILAYRVLEEAIDAGIYNLGGQLELWQIAPSGPTKLPDSELQVIKESVENIRQHELAVFEKHLTVTVSH